MARIEQILIAWLLVWTLVAPTPVAIACGPFFPNVIFIESKRPDFPLESYAAGQLGIVQPSYTPSYLAVAYRYFSSGNFDATEQKQLVALWNHYLHEQAVLQVDATTSRIKYAPLNRSYESYPNCLEDAFRMSEKTLQERSQRFGASSMAVASWREAQDKVFQNCEIADAAHPILPAPADAGLPDIIRKDREYQIAAAYFYSGNWQEAKRRLLAISGDSASPWRATAALVAARCDIREATLGDPSAEAEKFAAAATQLRRIIADPEFTSVKASAERLHGFVQFRLDPEARFLELSNAIERRTSPRTLQENLDDYTQLQRKPLPPAKLAAIREQSAMADWIYSFQGSVDTEEFRVNRWQQTKSLAWLVASLTYAQADTPQSQDLLDAAAGISARSPAYLTVAFHRDRLLIAQGKLVEARDELDRILKIPRNRMPLSAQNLFTALRMRAARNLEEFLQFAPRRVVTVADNDLGGDVPDSSFCNGAQGSICTALLLDADAARGLTQAIPTRVLAQAAQSSRLQRGFRQQVAEAAWTRAILLNDEATAGALVPVVTVLAPELAEGLKAYNGARTPAARRFAAAFLILHRPELHPYIYAGIGRESAAGKLDDYRDNWWCRFGVTSSDSTRLYTENFYEGNLTFSSALTLIYPRGEPIRPQFMSQADRQLADKEWNELSTLAPAPNWLGQQVLDWSKAHANDPRVPEALHMVVRATRYGCTDADSGDYSKQAFNLLHKRYPKNEWTAQTPYWFN
jgi:hypothetical protein